MCVCSADYNWQEKAHIHTVYLCIWTVHTRTQKDMFEFIIIESEANHKARALNFHRLLFFFQCLCVSMFVCAKFSQPVVTREQTCWKVRRWLNVGGGIGISSSSTRRPNRRRRRRFLTPRAYNRVYSEKSACCMLPRVVRRRTLACCYDLLDII